MSDLLIRDISDGLKRLFDPRLRASAGPSLWKWPFCRCRRGSQLPNKERTAGRAITSAETVDRKYSMRLSN